MSVFSSIVCCLNLSENPDVLVQYVNDIAKQFGGGGHAQAAGVTMHMPMDEAVAAVLAEMAKKLG